MLCDLCKQNVANVHFTKIINGKVDEKHLCEVCANSNNKDIDLEESYNFNKFFSGLFDNLEEVPKKQTDIICSNCGLSFNRFKRMGKFGCPNCYIEFKNGIKSILKGIHGHEYHKGKVPESVESATKMSREIEELNKKLEEAVKKEEFEKAATIRDEIKSVKDNLEAQGE